MKNDKPFSILLDMYNKECFYLYAMIGSLFNYPKIEEEEVEDLEGKLYASAFAYLCSRYLNASVNMYEHADLDLFIEEMDFLPDASELAQLQKKSHSINSESEDFTEMVWELINHYRLKIISDIHFLFASEKLKMRLFSSIFDMDDSDFIPELNQAVIEFFEYNFKAS